MAATVYRNILPDEFDTNWRDISELNKVTVEQCEEAWKILTIQKFPDCLSWCGDEILLEGRIENGRVVPFEKDEAALDTFDFDVARDEAYDEMMAMSEDEILTLLE